MTARELKNTILSSKLYPPRLRNVLDRPRLYKLADVENKRLVNISAGPGYGKTTLMAQLVGGYKGPKIWYQIDHMDHDPAVFLRHLITGFHAACGVGQRGLDRMSDALDIEAEGENILGVLLDEVQDAKTDPIRICFDDYHLIDSNSFASKYVSFLAKNLSDGSSILLTSRTLPKLQLARLRTLGLVQDVRQKELEFTFDELLSLVNEEWDTLIERERLSELYSVTEGWITAAVLAKQDLKNDNHCLSNITAKNEYRKNIYEYLAEEALDHLSERHKSLLLKVSLMNTVDPDICQTAFDENKSQYLLRTLDDLNCFVNRMDGATLYRLHPLFRNFLQERLKETVTDAELIDLRVRLADSYEKVGKVKDAIDQLILTNQVYEAIRLIEGIGQELLSAGEYRTIERWLHNIDESSHTALLSILYASVLNAKGNNELAIGVLRNVNDDELSANVYNHHKYKNILAQCSMDMGRYSEAIKELELALQLPLSELEEAETVYQLGVSYWSTFDKRNLDKVCSHTRQLANSTRIGNIINWADVLDALCALHSGRFHFAKNIFQRMASNSDCSASLRLIYQNNLASCQLMLGRYEESLELVMDCKAKAYAQRDNRWLAEILDTTGCALLSTDDDEHGMMILEEAKSHAESYEKKRTTECGIRCHIGTALRRKGKYIEAYWEHKKCADIAYQNEEFYDLAMGLTNMGADLMRMNRSKEAEVHLREAENLSRIYEFNYVLTHLDFHRAWASHLNRDIESVRMRMRSALDRANEFGHDHFLIQEGKISLDLFTVALNFEIHTDYANGILFRTGEKAVQAIAPLLNHCEVQIRLNAIKLLGSIGTENCATLLSKSARDRDKQVRSYAKMKLGEIRNKGAKSADLLTKRERQVLGVLATGVSNRDIAQQLFISEPTVKVHLNHIFRKLGLNNRIEAAALYYQEMNKSKNTSSSN